RAHGRRIRPLQARAGRHDRRHRAGRARMSEIGKGHLKELQELLRPIAHDDRETYAARFDMAQRQLLAHFSCMAEAERRPLAPEIGGLHGAAVRQDVSDDDGADGPLDARHTAIALVATASLAELQRTRSWGLSASVYAALAQRRPSWLPEAIEVGLDQVTSCFAVGAVAHGINRLVADGVPVAQHPHYAIGIAYGYFLGSTPLMDRVRQDLARIEDAIWRQFEVEGGGEISLAHFDKYLAKKSGGTWADVLIALAGEGHLDRQRLLDASLDALSRGFAQFRASWFSRFHGRLAPTIEERAARAGRYLDLLASPLGPTVALAMAALKALQRAGRLDVAAILTRVEPALFTKSAATAKGALALLEHAARSAPARRSEVARLAAIGLEHSSSEVQASALTLV